MTTLAWTVKVSLLRYLASTAGGQIETSLGARFGPYGIEFPLDESRPPVAFRGGAKLTGHGGMLQILLADPALERTIDGWILSVSDGYDDRIRIARVDSFSTDPDGVLRGGTTTLLPSGVTLFGEQYAAGSKLDSPNVRP